MKYFVYRLWHFRSVVTASLTGLVHAEGMEENVLRRIYCCALLFCSFVPALCQLEGEEEVRGA